MDLDIKLSEALLGSEKVVHTLDGEITLKIAAGTKHSAILRVKGKGVPQGGHPTYSEASAVKRGDLYIRISIQIPEKLSKEAHRLVEELKKLGL
jgi:DnaJ-class molecular chaperone